MTAKRYPQSTRGIPVFRLYLPKIALPVRIYHTWLVTALAVAIGATAMPAQEVPSGSVDTNFTAVADSGINDIALQADAKILLVGAFNKVNQIPAADVARLWPDGRLDTSFALDLPLENGSINHVATQTTDTIIVAGSFTRFTGFDTRYVARLHANGTVDTSFVSPWTTSKTSPTDLVVLSDHHILLPMGSQLYRLQPDGALEETFAPVFNSSVHRVLALANGDLLVSGAFTQVNGEEHRSLCRLTGAGQVVASFQTAISGGSVSALYEQEDQKLLVGGSFDTVNGQNAPTLVRLNADGTLDPLFAADIFQTTQPGTLSSLAVESSGKILIVGNFRSVDGLPRVRIARLNPNGSVDYGFVADAHVNAQPELVVVRPDDKILVAGSVFYSVNSVPVENIALLFDGVGTQFIRANIATAVEVGWNSEPGVLYQVQWTSELNPFQWYDLGTPVTGTGGHMYILDRTVDQEQKFYRIKQL